MLDSAMMNISARSSRCFNQASPQRDRSKRRAARVSRSSKHTIFSELSESKHSRKLSRSSR